MAGMSVSLRLQTINIYRKPLQRPGYLDLSQMQVSKSKWSLPKLAAGRSTELAGGQSTTCSVVDPFPLFIHPSICPSVHLSTHLVLYWKQGLQSPYWPQTLSFHTLSCQRPEWPTYKFYKHTFVERGVHDHTWVGVCVQWYKSMRVRTCMWKQDIRIGCYPSGAFHIIFMR